MNFAVFFKMFGLVMAGFASLVVGIVGVLFATGGFQPPYIPPEGISFEQSEYVVDEDTDIFVFPEPENATELDIELSILEGSSIISLPTQAEMNEPITVEVLKDSNDNNIGGVARVRANRGLHVAETVIYVDVPVENFDLASSNQGGLYVNDTFTVSPTNVYPQNSLNPTVLNSNYNKADKIIRYYSSNTEIATVDELTGYVELLAEGAFTIEARVIKTYNLLNQLPNIEDFIYEEDYWQALNEISTVSTRDFVVQTIEVSGMQVLDNQQEPLYQLDLHRTHIFTPSDFGLELLPQPDSDFTSEQLNYKIKDLEIIESNESVLQVETLEDVDGNISYAITVLNFETWQIHNTNILLKYSNDIFAYIHFEILQNNIESIQVQENAQNAIEVMLDADEQDYYNLEENTIITPEDETKEPTYTELMYRVDLGTALNNSGEYVIEIDQETGYLLNNIITPLNRGETRLKAFVIKTDINGNPVLDIDGNYNVVAETQEWTTVNVLEELTSLNTLIKEPKEVYINEGENLSVIINGLTDAQISRYNNTELDIVSSNENVFEILGQGVVESGIQVDIVAQAEGSANLFIMNNITGMFEDYVKINVETGVADTELIVYEYNYNNQLKTELIRGTEGFLIFEANSKGAFVDAYKYGKLEFISENEEYIQIYSSIDNNDNIIVKLVAVGFAKDTDGSFIQEESYSMIRIRKTSAGNNEYLVNERVNIDIGAVNEMTLHVNDTDIEAIPDVTGTQWLTQDGQEQLQAYVTFNNPSNPAVTGVQYLSGDTSILEIVNNTDGTTEFMFKKAGQVALIARSLDPYAIPTDPDNPQDGAYAQVILNVTTPTVVAEFNYQNLVDQHEEVIAGNSIDLLNETVLVDGVLEPRVQVFRQDGADYTDLVNFELVQSTTAAELEEIQENQTLNINRQVIVHTNEVGLNVEITIRLYTDFGYETFYNVRVKPNLNISEAINYPDNGNQLVPNMPEVIYPPTNEQVTINLLEDTAGFKRVNLTDLDGNPVAVEDINFSINNSFGTVNNDGLFTTWETPIPRDITITISINYASGINYESYYEFRVEPNIEILVDYNDTIENDNYTYEKLTFTNQYDLVLQGNVYAQTIDTEEDITDTLNYDLLNTNDYISFLKDEYDNNTSTLIINSQFTTDQYLDIRVSTHYDYVIVYRVVVLA
jgi:uncharacterized protein YlbG (UPF0298 family)